MGVVYNPDRNTLIPISTVSGEITYLTADLIYEKMQSCLIIGTEVTYLKHYPDQDLYIADYSYIQGGTNGAIFSNRAQRDAFSYFHRWNPNTQEFVIRTGVSLNLSNITKNGIMYFYFPNTNAYTILSYDYNRLFFNNVEEVKATIKVNYYLPDYDYTYAKITYKQDSEPASETDGKSVEILKDETSVNIEGLEEEKTYYFKIFTDKSESEAFPYTVEKLPYPPEYAEYLDAINGSGFFFRDYVNASKDVDGVTYYTQKYYPNQNYSWFTSSDWPTIQYNVEHGSQTGPINCAEIYTVELTSSGDDRYSYSITPTYKPAPGFSSRYWLPNYWFASGNVGPMDGLYCIESANGAPTCEPTWEGNNTLYNIFTQILVKYCKNVNIKVDGVYWSKVN